MVKLLLESEALTPKPTDGTKQKRNHTKHGVCFGAESGGLRGAEPRDTTPKYLGVARAARAPTPQGSGAAGGLDQRGAQTGGDKEEDVGRKAGWMERSGRAGGRPQLPQLQLGLLPCPSRPSAPAGKKPLLCWKNNRWRVGAHGISAPLLSSSPEEFAPQPARVWDGAAPSQPAG